MLGQGHRLEKQTRMKILSTQAQQFNEKFDELESNGVPLKEIPEILANEEKFNRTKEIDVLPFDESRKTIEVGSVLGLGFEKTHVIKSEAKEMNNYAREKMQKILENKAKIKAGLPIEEDLELKDFVEKSKLHDKKMKERIYKDHLNELINGDKNEITRKSNYGREYVFNELYQNDCDFQNFDHHYRKNDLKWYTEAYVRHKQTMRK